MKTIKKMMGATLLCGGIFALSACNDETGTSGGTTSGAVETTLENYLGYANVVAQVLSDDAFKAYALWMGASNLQGADAERAEALEVAGLTDGGYAARFKSHVAGDQSYSSEQACLYAIFDGCIDIATEVADAKMGEPYNNGDVYGVESWYSFNSYTDYDDNIVSIENCYMGGPEAVRDESKSLYQFCRQFDAVKADAVKTAIEHLSVMPYWQRKMEQAVRRLKRQWLRLQRLERLCRKPKPYCPGCPEQSSITSRHKLSLISMSTKQFWQLIRN